LIANVGKASSRGIEVALAARPTNGVDLFATLGTTRARFESGSALAGQSIAGNKIPNAPAYTASFGGEVSHLLTHDWAAYGRAEAVFYGSFQYDDMNTASQGAYSLADFRGGVRGKRIFGEAWVRNALDTRYIPVAFQYVFAQSGFVGEQGKPRTFGVRFGVTF
jgi:iron complex outermembrane receptor protein